MKHELMELSNTSATGEPGFWVVKNNDGTFSPKHGFGCVNCKQFFSEDKSEAEQMAAQTECIKSLSVESGEYKSATIKSTGEIIFSKEKKPNIVARFIRWVANK